MTGTIKAVFNRGTAQRYGFITDEKGDDRYFEVKDLVGVPFGDLQVGAVVTFDPTTGGRGGAGLRAVRVRLA